MPPLPPGLPPGVHPSPPSLPPSADLIPQAQVLSTKTPAASSLSGNAAEVLAVDSSATTTHHVSEPVTASSVSLSLNQQNNAETSPNKDKNKLKGGLTLVYAPDGEGVDEICMEELRASLPRYQNMIRRALVEGK